jgi:predicted amino acid dehydrogenase
MVVGRIEDVVSISSLHVSAQVRGRSSDMRGSSNSLYESIGLGELPPVQAAAVSLIPTDGLDSSGIGANEALQTLGDVPQLVTIYTTSLGRLGLISVPYLDIDAYRDREGLAFALDSARALAHEAGANCVSLMGLLSSATSYGRSLASNETLPPVTTGHATTIGSIILNIENAAATLNRPLSNERVGFLGLGSIGSATARAWMSVLEHPEELILCDPLHNVLQKRSVAESLAIELAEAHGYRGRITVLDSSRTVPDGFYRSTLIFGAANVPAVLDARSLAPGTVVIDDSAPHCFDMASMLGRVTGEQDVVAIEGGMLELDGAVGVDVSEADGDEAANRIGSVTALTQESTLPSCMVSALLLATKPNAAPTIGEVTYGQGLDDLALLRSCDARAPGLHCGAFVYKKESLNAFSQRYGASST